jgi:branched-chain amino acid transport system permease protein
MKITSKKIGFYLRFRWCLDRGLHRGAFLGAIAGPSLLALSIGLFASGLVWVLGGAERDIVVLFGINTILVLGLQSFVGNTGIMSFGHMAFMAIGAYTAGIVALPIRTKAILLPNLPYFLQGFSLPLLPAVFLGGIIAALFALMTGPIIARLSEYAAAITTFGLLVIVNEVLRNADALTRGAKTFSGVPASTNLFSVFVALVIMTGLSTVIKWSQMGIRTRAVRDDALAAEASGIGLTVARLFPFVGSAFITGVAGALWAHHATAFSTNAFFIPQTVGILAMMILGGIRSICGALVGPVFMTLWLEMFRYIEGETSLYGISQLSLGIALILLLRWRPEGIVGSRELQLEFQSCRQADSSPN